YSDLGIAPALCQAAFWNELFMTMMQYDGSPAIYDLRRWRREQQFEQEQERSPTLDLTWPPIRPGGGRSHIVQVLGFFIGEPPVEPPALLPREPALSAPPAPASARPQPAWATPRLATGPP
ncbi:MAG TPA: hypothetical protein VME47_15600, partial [Acetobacteraceae bacterium]|nr:hypothetical protein [Acetobacteraceae bacterium]